MDFTATTKDGIRPRDSTAWLKSIFVAEVQPINTAELHKIITGTLVRNDLPEWCCPDYIMEALGRLNEEQIVDKDD